MRLIKIKQVVIGVALGFFATSGFAGGSHGGMGGHGDTMGGHGNNHAALFVGMTKASKSTDATVGIEYEYRLPVLDNMLGVGVVVERIFADDTATVYVIGAVVHPWKALKLNASIGQERIEDYKKGGTKKIKKVARVGVGYDFHYGDWSYGPVYNLDTVGGKTVHVLGVAVGMGF